MLNVIILHGRLVRDPELRKTGSDVSVCSFTIAVDRDYQRQGEDKQTDFIDCVAWRSTAEFVSRYFTKGKEIAVQGSLQSRKWQDKDGNNRVAWEVQTEKVDFCGSKSDSAAAPAQTEDKTDINITASDTEFMLLPNDDLPF